MICDGRAGTDQIQKWLPRHPRFHIHRTPTGSSWLNLVERWFAELAHRGVTELDSDVRKWINERTADPEPFIWTKNTEQILDTLTAYCQRINNSGRSTG
ncbi:hypothetical protein GCM10029964_028920 [Kibdelosporangium lantanae]